MSIKIPVEVSARHVHLCQEDLEALFGVGYKLKLKKQLTQPSEFAAVETVAISNFEFRISNLRVAGPLREKSQVEISRTDAIFLGVKPPAGIEIIGPAGSVNLKEGLIIAERHIHCSPDEAEKFCLKDRDRVSVQIEGERAIVFHNVKVRVRDGFKLCLHLDTDEGNAAGIICAAVGTIL